MAGATAMADLHVHVARAGGRPVKIAASPRLTVAGILEESCGPKGLDIVGIVDAQSPPVLADLEGLVAEGRLRPVAAGGLLRQGDAGSPLLVILGAEVEVAEEGIGPVHYVVFLPDLETSRGFSTFLASRQTNVTLSSQKTRTTGDEIARWAGREGGFLVPAHVFTPYKGFFGQGGTDLAQVLSDRALEAVPAVELGLSADTHLARMVASLEPFTYLSNSDAHSPETIAREHNAIEMSGPNGSHDGEAGRPGAALDFSRLAAAIKSGRISANYGLDPRLGKYHRAYCPKCGFVPGPEEAVAGRACPACGKAGLVGGVLDRILQLSGDVTDPAGARPRPPYVHTVPLRYTPGVGPSALRKLLAAFGTEMNVLHRVPEEMLTEVVGERLAGRIAAARGGTEALEITPGAGGRYGRLKAPAGPT